MILKYIHVLYISKVTRLFIILYNQTRHFTVDNIFKMHGEMIAMHYFYYDTGMCNGSVKESDEKKMHLRCARWKFIAVDNVSLRCRLVCLFKSSDCKAKYRNFIWQIGRVYSRLDPFIKDERKYTLNVSWMS